MNVFDCRAEQVGERRRAQGTERRARGAGHRARDMRSMKRRKEEWEKESMGEWENSLQLLDKTLFNYLNNSA